MQYIASTMPGSEYSTSALIAKPEPSSQTSPSSPAQARNATKHTEAHETVDNLSMGTRKESQPPIPTDIAKGSSALHSTEKPAPTLTAKPESSLQTLPSFQSHASTATKNNKTHETVNISTVTTLQESLPPTDIPHESSALPSTENATSTLTVTPMSSSKTSADLEVYSTSQTNSTYTDESEKNSTWSTPEEQQSSSSIDMQIEILTMSCTKISTSAPTAKPSTSLETTPSSQPHASIATKNTETDETVDNLTETTIQETQSPISTDIPNGSSSLHSTETAASALTVTPISSSQTSTSIEVYSTSASYTTNTDESENHST
ncbi:hypothetical protein T265_06590 [Opisthorchis viverrini]|uniref:Uncharacterized protein n=1 Tax=Opisthorchis viverrini TaxID=6198 RepID=A0A074ZRY5_OPIVI|nr:hypothetical protein T265_06590 [Opisthorchis viverrini]KER26110.1 hypothetical protein T265_06590 [Opisthorchis viverrini]